MNNPAFVSAGQKLAIFSLKNKLPVKGIIKSSIFRQFCGGESIDGCKKTVEKLSKYNIGSILDYSVEGKYSDADYEAALKEKINGVKNAKGNPSIPFCVIKVTAIARYGILEKVSGNEQLSEDEKSEFAKVKLRLDQLCNHSFLCNVPLLIDAEESWMQEAIDDLAFEMMKKYNKEKPVIYNTIQLYRWDRLDFLKKSYSQCIENNLFLGIKLVRGAYMEKEKERAEKYGYKSPIHATKENTDTYYDNAISFCINNIDKIGLIAATHNEESCSKLVSQIEEKKLNKKHPHLYFGQLYGMSDQITYNLAYNGFNVAKYVPYGPVKEVLPYLIRRAQENSSIAGQMGRELSLIIKEKERRKRERNN